MLLTSRLAVNNKFKLTVASNDVYGIALGKEILLHKLD